MQITSFSEKLVIDWYPIKDWNNNIIKDKFLRILSFNGQTWTKRIVSDYDMGDEIINRKDNFNQAITINTKRPAQFVSFKSLAKEVN